jgi:hypothetical protein
LENRYGVLFNLIKNKIKSDGLFEWGGEFMDILFGK